MALDMYVALATGPVCGYKQTSLCDSEEDSNTKTDRN